VAHWRCEPIRRGIGAATGGVYRLAGIGHDRGTLVPWSLVLKVVRPPAGHAVGGVGVAPAGWGEAPADAHYWKREALAYQTGLQAELPRGLAAPRCLGIGEPSARHGRAIWLWLEEVVDAGGARWALDRYHTAARHLGRFNGAYLTTRPLPRARWLSRGLLRAWVAGRCAHSIRLVEQAETWEHPVVRRMFPVPVADRLLRLWAERETFFAALDRLPQTLCHLDASRRNLFARRAADGEDETVAIDWEFVGIGAVGQELGNLVGSTLGFREVEAADAARLEERAFAGYLEGLRDAGWGGDARAVRFAYAASAALLLAFIVPVLDVATDPAQQGDAAQPGGPLDERLAHQAAVTYFLLDLADEARALLPVL
jgi:hypothetical protein